MTFAEYWAKNEPFGSNPKDVAKLAWDAAQELEEPQRLQKLTDYMLNAALLQAKQYKERLEKCETALFKLLAAVDGVMPDYQYLNECKDVARAVVEEK